MALEAVSPASAALPELAHLHLLAHLAGVPTEASLSYTGVPTEASLSYIAHGQTLALAGLN